MSACAPRQDPPSSPSTQSPSPSPGQSPDRTPRPGDTNALLLLNENLRATLGEAYSDSWIEDNKLHVAVTTQAAAATVSDAGAIPKIVMFDAAALEAALQGVAAWQAGLPQELGAAIHEIVPDGRTGTLTLFVAPAQLDAVAQAAAAAQPSGAVPLVIKASTGLATPF